MKLSTSKEAAFICYCFKIFLVGKRGIRPLISFLHLFSVYKKKFCSMLKMFKLYSLDLDRLDPELHYSGFFFIELDYTLTCH